jgi:hypothetical protein
MCSNLPDNYTLSQFHIIRFGIYFVLRNFDSANFCGLNYHGGTPAVAPEGVAVANDAYRMTFISYPPEKMGDGLGHIVVGAMPTANDSVLKMSAEMQHVELVLSSPLLSLYLLTWHIIIAASPARTAHFPIVPILRPMAKS